MIRKVVAARVIDPVLTGSRKRCGVVAIVAVVVGSLLPAAPAFANRAFDSRIAGFPVSGSEHPSSVTFDSTGNVWISDGVKIFKYNPYPSQTRLGNLELPLLAGSTDELSLAVDDQTGQLFAGDQECRRVTIFSSSGATEETWNGFDHDFFCDGKVYVAIDNTNTYSAGRVYLSLPTPSLSHPATSDEVEVYDAKRRPVDFPAEASYIEANRLTGTPSGPFGNLGPIAVGPEGNLYVVDEGLDVVDEFDSTGTFIRTITGAGAPGQFIPRAVSIDPTNGNVLVADGNEAVDEFDSSGNYLDQITEDPGGVGGTLALEGGSPALNSSGYLYVPSSGHAGGTEGVVNIYKPHSTVPKVTYKPVSSPTSTSGTLNAEIGLNGGGDVTECKFEYVEAALYNLEGANAYSEGPAPIPCGGTPFASTTDVSAKLTGLTTDITYHYRVVVSNASEGGIQYGVDQTYTPHEVLGLVTEEATDLAESGATLNGSFLGNGEETEYYFEWGPTAAYGHTTAKFRRTGSSSLEKVSADLTGLAPYTTYHYRVIASNGGGISIGEDRYFTTTPGAPSVMESVSGVHSEVAVLEGKINPNGAPTAYHFEYVPAEEYARTGWSNATSAFGAEPEVGMGKEDQSVSTHLSGLAYGTTYDYRIVAHNAFGEVAPVRTFTTLPFVTRYEEHCANAHVRQQTGAAQLLDCRAYELVSASNTAGYDVESNIVPGQSPFAGYPEAEGRVLYGVRDGGIPGTGNPTNRGLDPYLAVRGSEGWSTEYVGIPSDGTPSAVPFASTLLEADAGLGTFVFGGSEICQPCFADGSTGEPVHLPDGQLVQGMEGPLDPGPSAEPAGYVAKPLSPNGKHLVFGSTSRFAAGGNEGQISIYDRNLTTGETHVVSDDPAGDPLPCLENCSSNGLAELAISNDGSHILLGQLTKEEGASKYWHLYMDVNDSSQTIALTPSSGKGVLLDGMTSDGSKVFFSSEEHLTHEDEEHSGPDIYMWEEGRPLVLVSKGANSSDPGDPGNTSSCDPASNTTHEHWNTVGSDENCGVVAVGGRGGVASGDGTIYFLSPELLDGIEEPQDGVRNAPNLYVARAGASPHFVATLESSLSSPLPSKVHPFLHSLGDFANPTGVAITEAAGEEGDFYVLDVTRYHSEEVQKVEKLDPSGSPVTEFGTAGVVGGQTARGTGNLELGSSVIESVTTTAGAFTVGQQISAPGIPAGTTIEAVSPGSLQISEPAVASKTAVTLIAQKPFSEYGNPGQAVPTTIAVDNDPGSPSYRDLYVPDIFHNAVDVFGPSGKFLSQVEIADPVAVAVDQANGDVYVASGFSHREIQVYSPQRNPITSFETSKVPTGIAVDGHGDVYVVSGGGLSQARGSTEIYKPSSTSPLEYGNPGDLLDPHPSFGVAVDPENNVYVDEGTQVSEFSPSGSRLGSPIGTETLKDRSGIEPPTGSIGLAASAEKIVVSNPAAGPGENGNVAVFSSINPSSPKTDNSLVVDSVSSPEVRETADFQITPDGRFAAFPSTLALANAGEETAGHIEIFRYDSLTEKLTCVSCSPTGAPAAGDASLASNGLSLTDEGRVFFNSTDQLAAADTDKKQDVYEWEEKGAGNCEESSPSFGKVAGDCLALISAGTSSFDSGLLSASSNGVDTYFFTRDSLVPQDKNGPTVKIYDAREGGGFPYEFPPVACKASDECHGASSPTPPPFQVGSEAGTPRNYGEESMRCKRGFVSRHGKCVLKRSRKHRRKHKHHNHTQANHKRGRKK